MSSLSQKLESAIAKHQAGDIGAAAQLYRAILDEAPDHPDALHMLGVIAQQMKKPELALALLDQALAKKPDLALAWHNRSLVLRVLGQDGEALQAAERAIRADPGLADAWDTAGVLLRTMGRHDESRAHHARAVALRPDHAGFQGNYALLLLDIGDLQGAYKAASAAERVNQGFIPNTLGSVLKAAGYPERAIPFFRRGYEQFPQYGDICVNEAMARLQIGDFEHGLRLWEARGDLDAAYENIPLWDGKPARHLLVHEDQGLGDVLQFIRYLPLIRPRAEKLTLQLPAALHKLLIAHFPELSILRSGDPAPVADARVRLLSLPYLCGTRLDTVPANIPYLQAREEWRAPWRERLNTLPRPRVGIVWAGNPGHRNDRNRSLQFSQLEILLQAGRGHFVSLQKGRQKDQANLPAAGLFDADPFLDDFSATAGLIAELDLLITVDTAVAHLAGAMGKPAWMLIPFDPDWRWLLAREDSPWYPNLRLFRQNQPGNWSGAVAYATSELRKLLAHDQSVLTPRRWAGAPARQNPDAVALEADKASGSPM